jgi:RimJ/RimL family protein N-acetyltransferase
MIRLATPLDRNAVWSIIGPVIREGATYALPRDLSEDQAIAYWFSSNHQVFVAEDSAGINGTYYLRRNHQGGGGHVANCGYMTARSARGRGIASAMCSHSMEKARLQGFRAMQFNFVVSTNVGAIRLWERLGFEIVGRLPKAFDHPSAGIVDALVMYKQFGPDQEAR